MKTFKYKDEKMAYVDCGAGDTAFIWAHGWGVDHKYFIPLVDSLKTHGRHYILNLPGFGESPRPNANWYIKDYADFINKFALNLKERKVVWVGHSFGGRIGIKLAALYPKTFYKMVIIAGSGLPPKRSLLKKTHLFLRVHLFKLMKLFVRNEKALNSLRSKFGSSDYKNAGNMRAIFMNTFREFLEEDAQKIQCPVALYYGEFDTETKPDIGARFNKLIPNSSFEILEDYDHYTILTKGQHQLASRIINFTRKKNV